MTLIDQYQAILIFLLVGVAMVVAPMVTLALIRPKKPLLEKAIPYECGKDPIGDAQVCFDLRFYTDALMFVIFDVEAAFMFPWAVVFKNFKGADGQPLTSFALVEGGIFAGILFLGLIYVWAKGDVDWVKSLQAQPGVVRKEGLVPTMPEGPRELEPVESDELGEVDVEPLAHEPVAAANASSHGGGAHDSHASHH